MDIEQGYVSIIDSKCIKIMLKYVGLGDIVCEETDLNIPKPSV